MSEKLCYKCGSVLPHGCEYCPNCGAPAPLSDDEINRKAIIGHGVIVPPRGQTMADIREPATVVVPPPPPPPPPFADMNPDMPVDATDAVVHGPEAVAAEDATRLLTKEDVLAKMRILHVQGPWEFPRPEPYALYRERQPDTNLHRQP